MKRSRSRSNKDCLNPFHLLQEQGTFCQRYNQQPQLLSLNPFHLLQEQGTKRRKENTKKKEQNIVSIPFISFRSRELF